MNRTNGRGLLVLALCALFSFIFTVSVADAGAGSKGPTASAAKKCKKAKGRSAVAAKKCKRRSAPPAPASCVASSANPASPSGYTDREIAGDAYLKPPTRDQVVGTWIGVYGAVGDQFTATGDCQYTAASKSPGTWSIQGNYVVFTGGLTGFCDGHALLVQRSSLQMDFNCDTPLGNNYFAYSK